MYVEQIKNYLAFEDSDLLANRQGRLSEKQIKRIKAADQFGERFLLALFFIFLSAGIFVMVLAFASATTIGLWVGAVILFLIAGWLFRGVQTEMDDTVQKVQGEVNFTNVEKQDGSGSESSSKRLRGSGYEMRVGDAVFNNISPALIECMQGRTYAVYFTKTTRHILSVEPISNGK